MFGLFEAPGRYPFPQPLRVCHSGLVELRVISHPLVDHKLTVLRDRNTEQPTFRSLVEELVTLLAYEATRGVRVHDTAIETPVAPTIGTKLDSPACVQAWGCSTACCVWCRPPRSGSSE